MNEPSPSKSARFYDDLWEHQWRSVAEHSPLRSMRERLMLAEIGPHCRAGKSLLDVGSGDGHFIGLVAAQYPGLDVQGVDFSEAARACAPEAVQTKITVGNVSNLASVFPERRFDIISCSEVLEHVEDPRTVLAGIAAILAPGGIGVLTVPGSARYWSALDESAGHLRRFEHDDFPTLVTSAGLHVVKHFGWGATVGRLYYKLVRNLGPGRAAASAEALPVVSPQLRARAARTYRAD
jgi:SAM-dependent methyltransferase